MPYHIEHDHSECSGHAVIKDDDGKLMGCHETMAEAEAQMAALHAAMDKEEKSAKAGARNSTMDMERIQAIHDRTIELGAMCVDRPETTEIPILSDDNALKAIAKTDTELRIGNYIALFGGRDLEGIASQRKNADGSVGEFFTKSTVFDSPYTDVDLVAVDWEHGYRELEKDEVLGRVDWKTARIDDRGLFVERILNRRNRYVQFIEELIEAGLIGSSSEAINGSEKIAGNGEIQRWPLRRDTLTVQPMDSRMITQNVMQAIKALSERYPSLKSLLPADSVGAVEAETPEVEKSTATVASEAAKAKRLMLELELLSMGGNHAYD